MGGWLLGVRIVGALLGRAADWVRALGLALRDRRALAAETLLLRRQLALLIERGARPRRLCPAERLRLAWLAGWTPRWRRALVLVRPETVVRWQRQGFRLLWRLRSRPTGRPGLPAELRRLIAEMVAANPCWGEERVAAELLVKLGLRVSPRTVRRYWPQGRPSGRGDQRWATFVRYGAAERPPSPRASGLARGEGGCTRVFEGAKRPRTRGCQSAAPSAGCAASCDPRAGPGGV